MTDFLEWAAGGLSLLGGAILIGLVILGFIEAVELVKTRYAAHQNYMRSKWRRKVERSEPLPSRQNLEEL